MNIRQQKYKSNRLRGMSAYRAAIESGYSHATAWNAHANIEKRCKFNELLAAYGLDDDSLLEVIKEGIKSLGKNGKPDLVAKGFIEIALKLNGRLREKVDHFGIPITEVNIHPNKIYIFRDLQNKLDVEDIPVDLRTYING